MPIAPKMQIRQVPLIHKNSIVAFATVDAEDYEMVSRFKWRMKKYGTPDKPQLVFLKLGRTISFGCLWD